MTNGAYGIQNDAHAFGQAIVGMYHDWYDINPLPIRLIMQVHYGNNYPNAMWDPRYLVMSFGDGDNEMMYPLVVLDVAAHEVGHGITQFASDLIYVGESGALNESFSDMAAQAALYYFYGENDWKIGATIMKSGRPLRHMDNPRRDGRSIAHTAEYYDGLDVHYASGIFNKAFYNLAMTPGWDTQKAYTVFYYANLTEWFPDETFASAGCGVVRATMALQTYFPAFEPKDVIAALRSVGVYYNGETQTCKT
jgi:vibriolysin